jgi:hypothetical protein
MQLISDQEYLRRKSLYNAMSQTERDEIDAQLRGVAVDGRYSEITVFLEQGANENAVLEKNGDSILHLTRFAGCAQSLMENRANCLLVNKRGEIPLETHIDMGNFHMVQLYTYHMLVDHPDRMTPDFRQKLMDMAHKAHARAIGTRKGKVHKEINKYLERHLRPVDQRAPQTPQPELR